MPVKELACSYATYSYFFKNQEEAECVKWWKTDKINDWAKNLLRKQHSLYTIYLNNKND